ncbi:flagellar hook-associated protein 3 [Clostridium botulinum]|uniref:flagellar hook-associated protein FlgL n=1 Tax=Clostridium botulinum TaxID=1491 RepID=UPI0001F84B53|nr:flagellar hook-associated protein FlgL [Clostridium botulinum]NFB16701.1 flagellar hook-associated protein 3 [Clostridium botulinum]NFB66435.1 flagellar hook-associated protein 3 [Clostridium botulinum]NFB98014.1 flagellar hook-associated protein 3 [Clostridium botulinum]NFC47724.1 flagellar hook-associated protein 3 [Clostridium botulinum]NFC59025.1 flagellar hook-associated protein 3 [Clostridium botulinum]
MRITNNMMANSFMSDMNNNLENLNRINQQLTSGKNFSKPSHDPAGVIRSMQLYTSIDANKQYNKNISNVINWLDVTDTALDQIGKQLGKIRDKLEEAGNPGFGETERKALKDEVNGIIASMSQTLNTTFDGKYIFSGTRVTSKPTGIEKNGKNNELVYLKNDQSVLLLDDTLKAISAAEKLSGKSINEIKDSELLDFKSLVNKDPSTLTPEEKIKVDKLSSEEIDALKNLSDEDLKHLGEYNQMNAKLKAEISEGVVMEYNVTATEVLQGGGDLRQLLENIVKHLESDDPNEINKLYGEDLGNIDKALDNVLRIRAEVGAKQNRMDAAKEMNKETNFNMTEILSNIEDVNLVEKNMEFAILQSVYISSLQTSAKVLQPTLMDYLR